ncbi:MAG: PEP-CTERM sorting domain-containing protein [Burkholderiales bacterium]|nr:MAG: PEP-CTERM sorting domain-containing protein [Burkholderiales bacterium]
MSIRSITRALAGLGLCAAALTATAGPYSNLVVFGDSLSDSGNNALLLSNFGTQPLPPVVIASDASYSRIPSAAMTYSNGKVWTQYLAQSLGLTLTPSLAGGTNFSFGGAQTGIDGNDVPQIPGFPFSMRTQLNTYLGATGGIADPNALYIVAGGGNNIRAALEAIAAGADPNATAAATVAGYATDMAGLVANLKIAGAHHVLVLNTPNFGLTPLANALGVSTLATNLSYAMDAQLATALQGSGVQTFDLFSFLSGVVAAGPASGFSNLTHACAAVVNACDVNTSLFWDGIHPTTLAHQQLAAAVLAVAVPEPEVAGMLALGLAIVALSVRRRRAGGQQG